MMKRAVALILCVVMCLSACLALASCSKRDEDYKGEYITMYLTENIYDLDPANAYYNESTRNIVSLLFETLFVLDDDGDIKNALAADYSIDEKNNSMEIILADTQWTDNISLSADDVVFAWKRILDVEASYEAASLLFGIRNARKVREGSATIDDLGLYADNKRLTIEFEEGVDYDEFLLNLTSLALAPLRETAVKSEDWAKKSSTLVSSGPFKLSRVYFAENKEMTYVDDEYDTEGIVGVDEKGNYIYDFIKGEGTTTRSEAVVSAFILERNPYYFRNAADEEAIDVSVTPYKILVDCSLSDEDLKAGYENGQILYVGDIPMSLRGDFKNEADTMDSLSTHTYYFNQNALIQKKGSAEGEKLFAIKEVRQALSMVIDREAIANTVVFAEAASGLVPSGVYGSGTVKKTFRDSYSGGYDTLKLNKAAAAQLLVNAGITPSDYTFSLTVAAYDDVHVAIAESVVAAWCELGFNAELKLRGNVANNDWHKDTDSIPTDICDNLYNQDLKKGDFEVIALDMVAMSASPFAVLAPYARAFSGQGMIMDITVNPDYALTPHITGYDSEAYNAKIEEAFKASGSNKDSILADAEKILMDDMAVMPIIYNKYATLKSEDLDLNNKTLWWTKNTNYYTTTNFKKMTVDNYEDYLVDCAKFIEDNYDKWSMDPFSYFYTFGGKRDYDDDIDSVPLSFEEFKKEASNYEYLFTTDEDKK